MKTFGRVSVIYYLLLLFTGSNCGIVRQAEVALSHKEQFMSPYEFIYCPASIILVTGDTISGRFTNSFGTFYLIHEKADSNIYAEKKRYPVTDYYKKFFAREISKYQVRDGIYVPTVWATAGISPVNKLDNSDILFMKQLSPIASRIQLYLYYATYHNDQPQDPTSTEKKTILTDIIINSLSPPDTSFGNRRFDYNFFIHLPGQPPQQVNCLYLMDKEQKEELVRLFQICSGLQPVIDNITASPGSENLVKLMVDKADYTKQRVIPALLAVFAKYDSCYYKSNQ